MNAADGEGFVRNRKNSSLSSRTNGLEVENGSYHFIYDLSLQFIVSSSIGPNIQVNAANQVVFDSRHVL